MFTQPAFHDPCNPFAHSPAPAGVRTTDHSPRRFFGLFQGPNFTTTRSPAPTPDSSPLKPNIRPYDDPPQTVPLAHLFAGDRLGSPQRPSTPTPMRPPNVANFTPARPLNPMPVPPPRQTCRKTRRGPKHLSFGNIRRRSSVLTHRRAPGAPDKRAKRKKVKEHKRHMAQGRGNLENFLQQAETATMPRRAGQADKIFLSQLEKLWVDHEMDHDLEEWRQRMARANGEIPQRMEEHVVRDEHADKMWEEDHDDEEAQKEQERKVEEFIRGEEDKKAQQLRQMEEEALRADEKRQRVHNEQERKIREEQDRLLREALNCKKEEEERKKREEQGQQDARRREWEARERKRREEVERQLREERILKERERQLREEQVRRFREQVEFVTRQERQQREEVERLRKERLAREAQEHILREQQERFSREREEYFARERQERLAREEQERVAREQERIAREQQERLAREQQERERQARRAALEEQVREQFVVYEAKWHELRTSNAIPPIDVHEMPWPVLGAVSSAHQVTYQDVRAFLFHPLRPDVQGKSARDKVKAEVLRFHPDKFNARVVPRIQEAQQAVAKEIAGAIARILTRIMTEEE